MRDLLTTATLLASVAALTLISGLPLLDLAQIAVLLALAGLALGGFALIVWVVVGVLSGLLDS